MVSNPQAALHHTCNPSEAASSVDVRRNNRSPHNIVGILVDGQDHPNPRIASRIIRRPPRLIKPSWSNTARHHRSNPAVRSLSSHVSLRSEQGHSAHQPIAPRPNGRAMIQYFSDTSLLGSGGGATGRSFSSSLGLFTCHLAHPTYVDMQAAYIFGCLSDQHVPHNKSMSCTFDSTSEFHMNHVL